MFAKKVLTQITNNQDGAVLVLIAVFMAALIGMAALALDLGFAFNVKAELQKDLDSVVLAAVRELPATSSDGNWDKAVEVAEKYAELNNISNFDDFVITKVFSNDNTKIVGMTISGDVDVTYNFAKVLGFPKGNASAETTAEIRTINGGMKGLRPFAIDKGSMDKVKNDGSLLLTLKADSNTESEIFGNGWFGAVDINRIGNCSGSEYETSIKNGSTNELSIGDTLEIVQGDKVGKTESGLKSLLQGHFGCTINSCTVRNDGSCPRIIKVPIVNINIDDKGTVVNLTVISFARVFIELEGTNYFKNGTIKYTGNDGEIKVTFIEETIDPTANVGDVPEENNYGFYSPRLVN